MSTDIPSGPFFVPPYEPDHGGVDFLGLRQANLDMMATCLPGINNVTSYIRPFSLLAWIHWRFHQLTAAAGKKQVSTKLYLEFRERVELLFTWGHVANEIGGIPGTTAKPPKAKDGAVPLTFAAWKRSNENTSLMAAVQYGPASKTMGGLGFIDPTENGLFRVCGDGVRLAEAIHKTIMKCRSTELLNLEPFKGREEDAQALFPGWSVETPTKDEQAVFRRAFFDESSVGEETEMGRRSSTLALAKAALVRTDRALSLEAIRKAMVYGRLADLEPFTIPERLRTAHFRWIVLQLRQAQRFAHECLLVWLERRIARGDVDSEMIIKAALSAIDETFEQQLTKMNLSQVRSQLVPELETFQEFCERAVVEDDVCLFAAIDRIEEALKAGEEDDTLIAHALRTLLLCAKIAELLADELVAERAMGGGLAERVSLKHWRGTVARCGPLALRDFLMLVLENMVLSQHFAVAANRYDGGTQRLRISIEEDGLTLLDVKPWRPTLTPDRLESSLSLAADCALVGVTEDGFVAA